MHEQDGMPMKSMPSQIELMNREWDGIAARNPHYGIFSWPDFQDPACIDEQKFDASGRVQVDTFLDAIGIEKTRGKAMLEIGCGIGRMTHRFAELFQEVCAVDISQEMIDRARVRWGHLPNVRFVKGTGQDLAGVEDESVHFVFSFLVLQHVTDSEIVLRYIRECARVLRPSGMAFLQFGTLTTERSSDPKVPVRSRIAGGLAERLPDGLVTVLRNLKRRLNWLPSGSPAYWWNAGLWRTTVPPRPDLTEDITRMRVWSGCRVPIEGVLRACAESGLAVRLLDGVGTQYTFLTAVKQG